LFITAISDNLLYFAYWLFSSPVGNYVLGIVAAWGITKDSKSSKTYVLNFFIELMNKCIWE
jgi:hypothetical protein